MAERGRPPEYNPDLHIPLGRGLAKAGFAGWEIAEEMGIDERTFYKWKAAFEDFRHAVTEASELVDERVKESLHKRATGYTIKLKKQIALAGPSGSGSELVEAEYDQHVPADPGSIMNWLGNRQRGKWSTKPEPDSSNDSTLNIQLTVGPVDNSNVEVFIPEQTAAPEEKKD